MDTLPKAEWNHYEQALKAGYKRFGAGPFLVKQIRQREPIYQVGNIEL
ncbi:MAG: hypothetical protein ACHRXM_12960 [Isosphaerales bacterium]